MGKLDEKVAVITGGTSGMALATAELFAAEGAQVFVTGRRKDKLDAAVAKIAARAQGGAAVTGVQGDAGSLADLDRLFEAVRSDSGRIDVLFASAGDGNLQEPLGAITEQGFDNTFGVNVKGTAFTVQKALPLMGEGGSIVLNSSIAAVKGFAGSALYSASKAAVRSLARTFTAELAPRGIRVNAISPGSIVDTGTFDGAPEETVEMLRSMIPVGKLGLSRQIATAVLFLASDDGSFVTGLDLQVDGGMGQV